MIAYLLTVLFFSYEFIIRILPGTQQALIMQSLQINHSEFSILSSTSFVLMFGLMQLPIAFILKRYALKIVVFISLLLSAIGCFIMAMSGSFYLLLLARMFMGLGTASAYLCVLESIHRFSQPEQSKLLLGLSTTIAFSVTCLLTPYLVTYSQELSYQYIYYMAAIIAILLAVTAMLFIPQYHIEPETITLSTSWRQIRQALSQKSILCIVLYSACLYCPLEYICENEGMLLFQTQNFTQQESSYMVSTMWLGYAIGTSLLCWLSNKILPTTIMRFASIASLVLIISIIYFPSQTPAAYMVCLFFGLSSGAHILTYHLLSQYSDSHLRTTSLALNQITVGAGMSIIAPSIGLMIDYNSLQNNLQYTYQISLWLLIIIILISWFITHHSESKRLHN